MAALFFCAAEASRPVGGVPGKPGGLAGWHPGALTSISRLVGRPRWGHPVGHDDPACRRRFPPWRAGEPPTFVGGLREDILFKSKEYPLALPNELHPIC